MSGLESTSTIPVPLAMEVGTLDLTRIKLTVGQMMLFVALVAGFIGTSSVSLYQLSEVRKAQQDFLGVRADILKRLSVLEADKARREGIEVGMAMAEQAAKAEAGRRGVAPR